MVLIKLSIVLAVLFSISSGKVFTPYIRWILNTNGVNSGDNTKIKDSLGGNLVLYEKNSNPISASCGSTDMSSLELLGDFSTLSLSEVAIGIWFFQSDDTSSDKYPFSFIHDMNSYGKDFSVRSDTGSYYAFFQDDNSNQNNDDDMTISDVLNQWVFITFYWTGAAGDITWDIYLKTQIFNKKGSNPVYVMPTIINLGSFTGFIYEVIVCKSASFSGSVIPYAITLADDAGTNYIAISTTACSASCTSDCHPKYGCLSSSDCQCPVACSSCASGVCQGCTETYRTQSTDCLCFENCPSCDSNTVCNHCDAGYFLKTDSDSNLRCFSCASSCHDCIDGECYQCADFVVQDSGACRLDSVGFQISFSYPNIIIEFANPLKSALTKDNFSALDKNDNIIDITNWVIDSSSTLSITVIKTENVKDSDLPITVDFSFGAGT
ncbi:unnamed protein product [Blepharisma stoltei]|uniref:Uncharacterized protein n=1 Tax=Blepharisma stoltei TaxID=1481888 RepID=A0AAU9IQC6_9CILI|nr:unnamed protein product [Blepharisma stoltei]